MGVKGLYTYIQKHCTVNDANKNGERRKLSYFENKTIIVDVSIYMYKFKNTEKALTELFDNLIQTLLKYNTKVLLAFDGKTPIENEKKQEMHVRQKQKETNTERMHEIDIELKTIGELMENCNDRDMSDLMVRQKMLIEERMLLTKASTRVTQKERSALYSHLVKTYSSKVEFIYDSTEEADKVISRIARKGHGKVIVMSDDTDMFLYGCPIVAMNYDPNTGSIDVYELRKILHDLKINLMELIQICIMVGTDFLSPFHENSPLPKISITQMFVKFYRFKEHLKNNRNGNNKFSGNFIDFMCFIYIKNAFTEQEKLNRKLWSIFEIFYKTE